jgi:hypothetical protein
MGYYLLPISYYLLAITVICPVCNREGKTDDRNQTNTITPS